MWLLLGLLRYRGSGGRALQEDWEARESLGTTADRLQWTGEVILMTDLARISVSKL